MKKFNKEELLMIHKLTNRCRNTENISAPDNHYDLLTSIIAKSDKQLKRIEKKEADIKSAKSCVKAATKAIHKFELISPDEICGFMIKPELQTNETSVFTAPCVAHVINYEIPEKQISIHFHDVKPSDIPAILEAIDKCK
jgi:hypothetical protein